MSGQEIPDPVTRDLAQKLDKVLTFQPQPQPLGFPGFPQSTAPSVKASGGKKYMDQDTFYGNIQSGKCVCSYKMTKGVNVGLYCGTVVKNPNPSLSPDSQKCGSHSAKGAVDHSANGFNGMTPGQGLQNIVQNYGIPTLPQPLAPPLTLTPQPVGVVPGINTLNTEYTPNILNFDKLKVPVVPVGNKPFVKKEIGEHELFTRIFQGTEITFTTALGGTQLILIKSPNGSLKCQGRIDKSIQNNGKPLPDNFNTLITCNFTNDELTFLNEHSIEKIEDDGEEENDDENTV